MDEVRPAELHLSTRPTWLERRFGLVRHGTSVRREAIAGATSFLAAAYLLVVIPGLLASGGIDRGAATTATIVVFVLGTLFMAFHANLPFLVGPGLGGSALVGIILAKVDHVPWQIGLGIAFWSGVLFLVLTLAGMRDVITRVVPRPIKLGLGASIGIFIALLGFRNAGLVMASVRTNSLGLADFTQPGAIVALIGLLCAIGMQLRKIPGAILWSILLATAIGVPFGVTKLPAAWLAWPHGIGPVLMQVHLVDALSAAFLPFLFIFFASEFFSTMGTTLAVGGEAGLLDAQGNMPNINRPFVVDSVAATLSPLIGVPAPTALIESAAGVETGGRTGLTAVFAAGLFLLMLLFTPIALMIPKQATAPALILIGLTMFSSLRHVDLANPGDSLSVLLMVLMTLISNSFGTGIAAGLLFYVAIKVVAGQARQVPLGLYLIAIPLVYYFVTLAAKH